MLDPFAIRRRRSAEEDEIEIFQLVVGSRSDHGRLVVHFAESAGVCAGRIQSTIFAIGRDRSRRIDFDLVADERERVDVPTR